MAASTTLTPAQRVERARKAARARHSLDTYVKSIVDRAPELTPAQVDLLRSVFADGRS